MKLFALLLVIFLSALIACKKDADRGGGSGPGPTLPHAPIADAGPDQFLTSPTTTFTLDGSNSKDTDGDIVKWQWTRLTGAGDVTIHFASQKQTTVKVSWTGVFQFELQVTDNGGLTAKDTVNIFLLPPGYFCDTAHRSIVQSS